MDVLIKNVEKWTCFNCPFKFSRYNDLMCPFVGEVGSTVFIKDRHESCPLVELPSHNDLADKSVIIERMGEVYEALYDKVDKKALSECHVAFLKAVMYAPTVIPSTVKIPTEGIEPKGVWDETWTTEAKVEGERTT